MSTTFRWPHGIRSGASASVRMSVGELGERTEDADEAAVGVTQAGSGSRAMANDREDDRVGVARVEAARASARDGLAGPDRRVVSPAGPHCLAAIWQSAGRPEPDEADDQHQEADS